MMIGRLTLLGSLALAGCGMEGGDTPAYPIQGCRSDPAFVHQAALDDASRLGFSGADIIGALNARGPAPLTWQTGATTSLTIQATAATTTASVDAPPPFQGYCAPSIAVDTQLHLVTPDGRLEGTLPARLVGLGADRALETVFPVDASFRLVRPTTLPIPASWFSPARPYEQVSVQFHIDGPGVLSPYCLPGEPVSDSPGPSCNRYSGLIRFVAYNPDAPVEGPRATMEAPIGWWTW